MNFTKVIRYIADTTSVKRSLVSLRLANMKIAKAFGEDFSKATKTYGQSLKDVTRVSGQLNNSVEKTTQNIKTADGRFGKLIQTTTRMKDGNKKVTTSFKEMDKSTASLGANVGRLMSRAALTIPIWLALRGAVMGTISAFKNSVAGIIKYDKALQKLKKNLQGTPEEITKNFNRARDAITRFAVETGKDTDAITNAIQRFATVGFDFETAMSAGFDATRLSILLFGEAEETANAFARSMRVLVTNTKDSAKTQEEIAEAMTLTSELYEVNAFVLKELNGGLEKFAGTAKTMGFTIAETITLLAALSTRGLNAERAGRLLRTTTQKLEMNLAKVASVLGIKVNPAVDRTFDVFVKVTNAISKLKSEAGTISPAVSQAIGELFGGVRGGEPIRDLIADMGNVNEAFDKFLSARPDIGKFRNDVEEMNDTLFRQVEIFHNLNKETGKAFITGVVQGDNFIDALDKINTRIAVAQKNSEKWGTTLIAAFQAISVFGWPVALERLLKFATKEQAGFQARFEALGELAGEGLKKGLSKTRLDDAIKELARLRTDLRLSDVVKPDAETLKGLDEIENAFIKIGSATELTADNLEEVQKNLVNIASGAIQIEKSFVNISKLNEIILKDVLTRMKSAGALNSELTKTEIKLRKQFNIQGEWNDEIERQLLLERQISEEKRLQSRFSSETAKVFRIAQEKGIEIAKQIGDALAGKISFNDFIRRGGEAVEIFKKDFADVFEQQQMEAFFSGGRVPGLPGLRGGGRIPIREEATQEIGFILKATLEQNRLMRKIFPGGVTQAQKIQEMQVARMNVALVNLPVGGGRQERILSNALLQGRQAPAVPGQLTNASLQRYVTPPETRFDINFEAGSFIIHGTPDKATQDAIKNAVTDGIKNFQDKLVGKQTNVL